MKEKELARLIKLKEEEQEFFNKGIKYIAGIDEAGRGPLAGPVVVASVILPENSMIEGVNDSKKVSENKRERLYGKYDFENKDYYNYLFEELSLVLEKIKGLKNWPKKIKLWYQKQLLKKYL